MKKIKQIDVEITYTVSLCDLEVEDNVYDELLECIENGTTISPSGISGMQFPNAADWLSTNIQESDCMEWDCELSELDTED
ncbi:hypothetical protein [Empedobacter brevis]|uniref:hypothetical protein n=1 Tax=Empedobacter brevis TaxID=247 RepID=UPI0028A0DC23|nr:hypothetical protein [Empedobacter brevis]